MDEKTSVMFGTIITIFLGIIASLIAWLCGGEKLQGKGREAIRQMFNFELTFFILAVAIGWIPLLGQLAVFIIWIANIVFAIKAYNSVNSSEELKIPAFNIIK